jgi:hypothetical protein
LRSNEQHFGRGLFPASVAIVNLEMRKISSILFDRLILIARRKSSFSCLSLIKEKPLELFP